MPIKLIPLTCPSCGAQLEVPADKEDFYCGYCGTRVHADDGTTKISIDQTVTIRDEAALRRIEIEERRERERQDRREAGRHLDRRRWLRLIFLYPVLLAAVFVGSAVLSGLASALFGVNTDSFGTAMASLITLCLFIGTPVWIVLIILKRPRK